MGIKRDKPARGFWRLLPIVLVCLLIGPTAAPQEVPAQTQQRPNIVFILTDDQDEESIARMRKLRNLLVNKGTRFPNAFVTTPACCPSRATFLRGQYAHNHRILGNNPPLGGFEKFRPLGRERSTIATWLDEAGYVTGYMGKYLNGYGENKPTRYVPPGWDKWWGRLGGNRGKTYSINANGAIKTYNRHKLHDTDYYSARAEKFIRNHGSAGVPWFLVVATSAPHHPAHAAERHQRMFRHAQIPKPPSFNEKDVSDKPRWIRRLPRLDGQGVVETEREWRQRQRSLQAVDDLVGNLVGALGDTGQLRETYVVYASDNGYLFYRHRLEGKGAPYEESIGVPLILRGPDVPVGVARRQIVANIDWAPTIADWAQVEPPSFVDGRSFDPLLDSSSAPWRRQLLIEFHPRHEFRGLRTAEGETYVEYETGEKEYYDLATDPWQVKSAHRAPQNAGRIGQLSATLSNLKSCAGATCRTGENEALR